MFSATMFTIQTTVLVLFLPVTGTLTVHVNVTDKNDNDPQFTHPPYIFRVEETHGPGMVVHKLTATDKDTGRNADIRYTQDFSTTIQQRPNSITFIYALGSLVMF